MRRARRVILYEVNEVPWAIVDLYLACRSGSALEALLARGRSQTTHNGDPTHLQPWRTWPTFHTGLYSDEHNSFELGQDPSTFRGETIWDVAEARGLRIGVFQPLQSWPARCPRYGGFYVPDTFSRDAETHPPALRRFQEFNLAMTRDNGFSSDAPLDVRNLALAGADMLRRGLTPWSAYMTMRHLARERKDERYKAARSMVQPLPAFDLYWRLHKRTRPHLSVFFTNHVAGMMHRFWGDTVPGYAERFGYSPDDVFRQFVLDAMDVFDHQIARLMRFVDRDPESVLMVASSMGQNAIPRHEAAEHYVVEHADRLVGTLGIGPAEPGLAMYPRTSLEFPDDNAATRGAQVVRSATLAMQPLFADVRVDGHTVSFMVRMRAEGDDGSVTFAREEASEGASEEADLAALGLVVAPRLGGANTAHHTPEGILITYGDGVSADTSRAQIDAREAKPMILDLLGINEPSTQRETAAVS